jgi:GTPase SAR1 family protein
MADLNKLREIAEYCGLSNLVFELEAIDMRSKQENASLILPLVGEFSSGKTTLINALTDSKKLETATKPTTATIYEVHFGCDSCYAEVVNEKGELYSVQDVTELKNDSLADAKVVTVFDTSNRVPSTTILVDTPGLSSPDPKHKQTLVSFLPKADGIMLVTDINQQITRSLTDFIETMKLSKRPIYLILSKSDTKSESEIEAAKKYISDNCQIPLKQIAVVSASTGSLDELYSLLDSIQKDKKDILKKVDSQRIKNVINVMTNHIDELMKASNSDKDLEEAIRRCQYELDKISRNIDRLVDSMSDDIEEEGRTLSRKFEDTIFSKLNGLVTGKSSNFDAEAISIINNTATLLLNEYRNRIKTILREKANQQKGSENEVTLSSLEEIDMSMIQMTGLSYNLDLNLMGHEYDSWIKTGVIAVSAVAAVAAVAASRGTAAVPVGTSLDKVIDIADTVSDIGSMVSNHRTVGRIEEAAVFVSKARDKYNSFNELNQQMGQQMGSNKGMVDSIVGLVTDKMMAKPQRVRAIRNYIDSSLTPEFKLQLSNISQSLVNSIRTSLQSEASILIGQKTDALNQLKSEMKEKKEVFENRMEQLREFKTLLLTI